MKILQRFSKNTYILVMTEFVAGFHTEKSKYFCLDLHYVHKEETGQRHTFKNARKKFYPQMKILQRFSKTRVLVMAVFVPDFHIENRQLLFLRSTLCS